MSFVQEARDAAYLFAPGFIALKLFYQFGAQRPRAQWEWLVWSALASVPLDWVARQVVPAVTDSLTRVDPALVDGAVRVTLGIAAGVGLAIAWRLAGRSDWDWLRSRQRDLTDSAFDLVVEEAVRNQRFAEVLVRDEADQLLQIRGRVHTFARESAQAEPWLYINVPETRASGQEFRKLPGTHGVLIHRDNIQRVRILLSAKERDAELAEEAAEARSKASS